MCMEGSVESGVCRHQQKEDEVQRTKIVSIVVYVPMPGIYLNVVHTVADLCCEERVIAE